MKEQTPELRFFCPEYPATGNSATVEHITADGNTVLCGAKAEGRAFDTADWESVHSPRFHRRCKACQKAAVLRLRPTAEFWYIVPFNTERKEFPSLKEARKNAATEYGNCTIWQTGPGEINQIVETAMGLPMLP